VTVLALLPRLLLFFLGAHPVFAGHPGSVDLNPRRATPGLRLELIEMPLIPGESAKGYHLRAAGYPRDIVFSVFAKSFADSFGEVVSGFRVNKVGSMVSDRAGQIERLEDMVLRPGPYPRGAAWEVALVSADRSFAAFARTIPYPITNSDGACSISLELLSKRGDRFFVTGSGFAPGEDVMTESRFDGRIEQKRKRIPLDGLLPKHVISHAAIGTDRSARYMVKSRTCEVAVDYDWGEAALVRR
jgi:hypothetical protein